MFRNPDKIFAFLDDESFRMIEKGRWLLVGNEKSNPKDWMKILYKHLKSTPGKSIQKKIIRIGRGEKSLDSDQDLMIDAAQRTFFLKA